jgi:hypothetical protein
MYEVAGKTRSALWDSRPLQLALDELEASHRFRLPNTCRRGPTPVPSSVCRQAPTSPVFEALISTLYSAGDAAGVLEAWSRLTAASLPTSPAIDVAVFRSAQNVGWGTGLPMLQATV